MILIRVTYHTKPGMRGAFAEKLLSDGVMTATRQEPGNVDYAFSLPIDKPNAVELLEMWEDQAALDVHCTSPMFLHLRQMKEPYVIHSDIVMFDARQR